MITGSVSFFWCGFAMLLASVYFFNKSVNRKSKEAVDVSRMSVHRVNYYADRITQAEDSVKAHAKLLNTQSDLISNLFHKFELLDVKTSAMMGRESTINLVLKDNSVKKNLFGETMGDAEIANKVIESVKEKMKGINQ